MPHGRDCQKREALQLWRKREAEDLYEVSRNWFLMRGMGLIKERNWIRVGENFRGVSFRLSASGLDATCFGDLASTSFSDLGSLVTHLSLLRLVSREISN